MSIKKEEIWSLSEISSSDEKRLLGTWRTGNTEQIILGRSADADILIGEYDLYVSRKHLEIIQSPKCWKLKNTGRSDVIRLRDEKVIKSGESIRLCPEDSFKIGSTSIACERIVDVSNLYLCIRVEKKVVYCKRIGVGQYSVGADADNDISVNQEGVSRHHLTLTIGQSGDIDIQDNSSKNGVFVVKQDQKKPMRVDAESLCCGESFCMGSAVCTVHEGSPNNKSRGPIYLLIGLMSLIAIPLLIIVASSPEPEEPIPVFDTDTFERIWLDQVSNDDLISRIDMLMDAAGTTNYTEWSSVSSLREALAVEKRMKQDVADVQYYLQRNTRQIRLNPWKLTAFSSIPFHLQAKETDKQKYEEIHSDLHRIYADLEVSPDAGRSRFDGTLPRRWLASKSRLSEYQDAVHNLKQLLSNWQSRQWSPAPTASELEVWQQSSQVVGSDFAKKTVERIALYKNTISQADDFWREFDQWIAKRAQNLSDRSAFVGWLPIPQVNNIAGDPIAYVRNYISADKMQEAKSNMENMYAKDLSDLTYLLALADLCEIIPEKYRQSYPDIRQGVDQVADTFAKLVKSAIAKLGNPEGVDIAAALPVIRDAGSRLPRFDISDDAAREFSSLSSLTYRLDQLRLITIILAERLHSDLKFKQDEATRKHIIKELLLNPYMQDFDSGRKAKLLRWANS